jgi:hypothetical protein
MNQTENRSSKPISRVILIKRKKSKSNTTNENISIRKSFLNKEKEVAVQCEKEGLVPAYLL